MAQELEAAPARERDDVRRRLAEAVERKRSQLLVGLDPVIDLLPLELAGEAQHGRAEAAEACDRFCRGVIDAVAQYAVGVKPQLAFFEALGSEGMRALENVCAYARTAGLIVVADAKRGDIGSTARAYTSAYLEGREDGSPLADAMTVNPYLGRDSVEPFLAACRAGGRHLLPRQDVGRGRGRHPGSRALGRTAAVAARGAARLGMGRGMVGERGLSSVGAVVGATYPRAVGEARRLLPRAVLLLPGIGAQGAGPADVCARSPAGRQARSSRRRAPFSTPTVPATRTGGQPSRTRRRGSRTRSGRPRAGEGTELAGGSEAVRDAGRVPLADHGRDPRRSQRPLARLRPVKLRLLLLAAALALVPPALAAGPSVDARAYLVEDGRTGEVLLAHNEARQVPIASLTKMMTVLLGARAHAVDRRGDGHAVRRRRRRVERESSRRGEADGARPRRGQPHPERERCGLGARRARRSRRLGTVRLDDEPACPAARPGRNELRPPGRARRCGARLQCSGHDDARPRVHAEARRPGDRRDAGLDDRRWTPVAHVERPARGPFPASWA